MPANLPTVERRDLTPDLVRPSSKWEEATRQFWDLRETDLIPELQWELILDWLVETEFDSHSFIAAEVAFALIRDRAPMPIRESLQMIKGPPPLCRMTFTRVSANPASET